MSFHVESQVYAEWNSGYSCPVVIIFPRDSGVQLRGSCLLEAFMLCPVVCSFTDKPHCIIFTSELSPLVTHLQRRTEPADASKVTS